MRKLFLLPRGFDDFERVEWLVEHDRDEKVVPPRCHPNYDAVDFSWTDPVFGLGPVELNSTMAANRHAAVDRGEDATAANVDRFSDCRFRSRGTDLDVEAEVESGIDARKGTAVLSTSAHQPARGLLRAPYFRVLTRARPRASVVTM